MNQPVSEKGYKGLGMEGFTAKWYASLTLIVRRIQADLLQMA